MTRKPNKDFVARYGEQFSHATYMTVPYMLMDCLSVARLGRDIKDAIIGLLSFPPGENVWAARTELARRMYTAEEKVGHLMSKMEKLHLVIKIRQGRAGRGRDRTNEWDIEPLRRWVRWLVERVYDPHDGHRSPDLDVAGCEDFVAEWAMDHRLYCCRVRHMELIAFAELVQRAGGGDLVGITSDVINEHAAYLAPFFDGATPVAVGGLVEECVAYFRIRAGFPRPTPA
jgi:hypothetical protein